MGIVGGIAKSYYKVEVASDLPGRLRLKVRNFAKIPKDLVQKFFPSVGRIISQMDGILNVQINKNTGSILINYDKNLTEASKITAKIDNMIDVGIMLYKSNDSLATKSAQDIERAFLKMLGQK